MNGTFLELIGRIVFFGGSSVGIAYGFFLFLGKKWIENKFAAKLEEYKTAQNKELEDFRYKINSLFSRVTKIHEKEYEVLPTAWTKLHDAKDHIARLVSLYQEYPDFSRMKEQDIKSVLNGYNWELHEIADLISAAEKNNFFQDRIFWHRLRKAQEVFGDFHSYIERNRIFLSEGLKVQFNQADDLMWEALVTRKVGEEAKDHKMITEAYKGLKENIESFISSIEELVQERLRYNEAI